MKGADRDFVLVSTVSLDGHHDDAIPVDGAAFGERMSTLGQTRTTIGTEDELGTTVDHHCFAVAWHRGAEQVCKNRRRVGMANDGTERVGLVEACGLFDWDRFPLHADVVARLQHVGAETVYKQHFHLAHGVFSKPLSPRCGPHDCGM